MTNDIYVWSSMALLGVLMILGFSLKLEKLTQIVIGNYVLGLLLYSLRFSIDLFVLNCDNTGFCSFIDKAKVWILLILYIILFIGLVYRRSKITINFSNDPLSYKPLYILFVPLSVLSIAITILAIVLGNDLFSIQVLSSISEYTNNEYIQKIIINFPYILMGYSLLSLFAIIDLKFSVKLSVKSDSAT